MKNIILHIMLLISIASCYNIKIQNKYHTEDSAAQSRSAPIYLSFRNTRNTPFYFLLQHYSHDEHHKLFIRWISRTKGDLLFNGYNTTLKFLINKSEILTFTPSIRPTIVAFNVNNEGHEEEGVFILNNSDLRKIAYAKTVTVEITGRRNTVVGEFNNRNTFKAFKHFEEHSH